MKIICFLLFLVLIQIYSCNQAPASPQTAHHPDNQQKQESGKAGAANMFFASGKEESVPNPLSAAEREAARKQWEATPDGILYKKWEASPSGVKVLAGEAKIREQVNAFSDMEAVITLLTLPPGTRLGFALMAKIEGVNYILRLDPEESQLELLKSLKINDKIIIRSHAVSHAPKYAYPIITGDYVERDGKVIFKRTTRKDGC